MNPAPTAPFAGRAPLLERDRELLLFESRIAGLRTGNVDGGACALVSGEAGAGKTALVQAVRQCAGNDVLWLWGACEPMLAAPALAPLIDLLDSRRSLRSRCAPGTPRPMCWPACWPCCATAPGPPCW